MIKLPTVVPYLNGIRGVAAFFVFFHHFLLSFYPAFYTFDKGSSHLNGWDVAFGKSIFSVIANGNFCVCVFFVLSGFVLSRSYYQSRDVFAPVSALYRRFIRLYVPVATTLILAALLVRFSLFHNTAASVYTHSEWWLGEMWHIDNLGQVLLRSLTYDVMLKGNNVLDTTMWTICYELYGSLLVYVFLIVAHFARYRTIVMLALLFYFYIFDGHAYFGFLLGVSLCQLEQYGQTTGRYRTISALIIITLALLLGSYPSTGAINGTLFSRLGHGILEYSHWFHTIGAYLLVLAFVIAPRLQIIAGKGAFVYLGYISFSFYLIHPLILGSFSCWLFLHLIPLVSYHQAVILVFAGTLSIMLPLSWLMTKIVDEQGIALARKFANRMLIAKLS